MGLRPQFLRAAVVQHERAADHVRVDEPLRRADPHAGRRLLRLRVFVDRGSVEVYVNGGKQVMSSYSYAPKGPRAIGLVAESGSLTVTAGSSPLSPKESSKARGTKSEQRISSAIWSTTA